jgi:hypothetical protein
MSLDNNWRATSVKPTPNRAATSMINTKIPNVRIYNDLKVLLLGGRLFATRSALILRTLVAGCVQRGLYPIHSRYRK